MIRVLGCITGQHDLRLVALAGLLCLFACITATSMLARARATLHLARTLWLAAAGLVAGSGIWATHFIAMLAYRNALPASYDLRLTFSSAIIAIGLCITGYWIALNRQKPVMGGLVIGAAIAAMHYVGMTAVQMPATPVWDINMVAASIALAMVIMAGATRIALQGGSQWNAALGVLLFLAAILAMHFTGMTALGWRPDPAIRVTADNIPPLALATAVAAVAVLILALGLVSAMVDAHLARLALDENERLAYIRQLEDTRMELIAAKEEADAGNREKSNFLANMSHELRTPLNAIIGFSDMMTQGMFGALNPRYQEYAVLIHQSGEHLLDLISDILDMAKIEAGKFELNIEDADLDRIVHDCVRMVQGKAASRDAQIKVSGARGIHMMADRRALRQILLNLLSNAAKYCRDGGLVEVRVHASDDAVLLAVRDDGVGIPEEHLARLGQPFQQVTQDSRLARGGTGLGLALVYALAQRHGGMVRITSRLGDGTRVFVTLPWQKPVTTLDTAQAAISA